MEFPSDLIETLRQAKKVAVLTGAGISAESGVPTFRDAQTGLWARFNPQELASEQAFRQNPALVWEWYTWRREVIAKAKPNPGHQALVMLEERIPHFTLITQNVDGLHQRAGSGRRSPMIELHGNIFRTKCFSENLPVEAWQETEEKPPRCPRCGGLLRPDVVWFGELPPTQAWSSAVSAAITCDLFFTIGTSALVEPAASLPFYAARAGVPVVEVNPNPTPFTPSAAFVIAGTAGQALPTLVRAVWGV